MSVDYDIDYLRERITMDFSDWLDTAEAKALLALYDAKCEELQRSCDAHDACFRKVTELQDEIERLNATSKRSIQ